jgi:hypothetical protein
VASAIVVTVVISHGVVRRLTEPTPQVVDPVWEDWLRGYYTFEQYMTADTLRRYGPKGRKGVLPRFWGYVNSSCTVASDASASTSSKSESIHSSASPTCTSSMALHSLREGMSYP